MDIVKKHWFNSIIILGISTLFFVFFSKVVYYLTGLTVSNFLPGISDMASYYVQINSAIETGIFSKNAGYNGYIWNTDVLTVADSLYYGAHGLYILLPYIVLGKIIGWGGATPLIIHTILFTTAFYFVYFCTRSLKKTVAVQILTFTFIPLITYFTTLMMEMQMYVWGIIIISLLYAFVNRRNRLNHIGLIVAIILASSARITNVVFIIPYFVIIVRDYFTDKSERKNVAFRFLIGIFTLVFITIVYVSQFRLSATYEDGFLHSLISSLSNEESTAQLFTEHFLDSFKAFFDPNTNVIFVFVRYVTIGLAILLALQTFTKAKPRKFNIEPLYLSLILLSIALLNMMFYDILDWRDFRVIAPVLFAVIIYIVISWQKFGQTAIVVITLHIVLLIFLSVPINAIRNHYGEFHHNEIAKYMSYDPNAHNRYGNTIILSQSALHLNLYDIDAGLGVIGDMYVGFTTKRMAELGIKYIVTHNNFTPHDDEYYEITAFCDTYTVLRLKE